MTDALSEVSNAVKEVESIAPVFGGFLSMIPNVGPWFQVGMAVLNAVDSAVSVIQSDQGLSLTDSIIAFVKHITPGQPNAPALAK